MSKQTRRSRNPDGAIQAGRRALPSESRAPHAALPLALAITAILGTQNVYAGSTPNNAAFGSPAWFAQQRGAVTSTQTTNATGQVLTPTGQPFDTTSLVQKWTANLAASAQAIVAQQNALAGQGLLPVPSAAVPGAVVTPAEAQARAAQSIQDLSAALAAIQNQLAVQSAFHTAALAGPNNLGADPNHPGHTLPNVSNGLGAGALAPAAAVGTDPTLWQNAKAPTEVTRNGVTTVTIDQTAQKAILTWDSFDVGKNTALYFDQAAGTAKDGANNWIVMNRIVDPTDVPSQILGSIKAEGTVYLLNQNGIIFGGSSQVNTLSLIASSLAIYGDTSTNQMVPGSVAYDAAVQASNAYFLQSSNTAGLTSFSSPSATTFDDATAEQAGLKVGGVSLKAGANITTGNAGFTLLIAPSIQNAGSVIAQGGTAALIAGDQASSVNPGDSAPGSASFTVTGLAGAANVATNTGLVQATTGNVTLMGNVVVQGGVVEATTSITRSGSIDIAAESAAEGGQINNGSSYSVGPLTLGAGSLTALLPQENGQTTSSSAASSAEFTPGSVNLQAGAVTFQSGSLLYAPGESVSVKAEPVLNYPNVVSPVTSNVIYGRIYLDHGAVIDVSGLPDVELPMSANELTIGPLTADELADAPLQRLSALLGHPITIDTRIIGVNAETGQAWVGSPLIDAEGSVQAIARKIDQLLLTGGSIALTGGEVLTATDSVLDVGGGYIHYLGGTVTPTRLLGASGAVYSPSNADPLDPIVGFAGQTTVQHTRWGITEVYTDPLLSGAGADDYESDYIQGGNAGSLSISTLVNNFLPNSPAQAVYGSVILNGTLLGAALAGRHQVANGTLPTGGSFTLGPDTGQLTGDLETQSDSVNLNFLSPTVLLAAQGPELTALDPHFGADTLLATPAQQALFAADPSNKTLNPADLLYNSTLSTALLSAADFAQITVKNVALVESDAALSVQPGGAITLSGPLFHDVSGSNLPVQASGLSLQVLGQLSAPSGQIDLIAPGVGGSIEVGPRAILSARGQWVNDSGLLQDQLSGGAYVNGGSITLQTSFSANLTDPVAAAGSPSIQLDRGSILDVSSGGYVQPNGALELNKNGVLVGLGGSITLSSYNGTYSAPGGGFGPPTSLPTTGGVSLHGTLLGYGFAGGGTLSIQTLGFQIGGDPFTAPAQDLVLPASFFEQGFGAYDLQAVFDATVTSGTTLNVTQRNLIPNVPGLLLAPTGSNLYEGGLVTLGTLDAYHRQPTNLTLSAGAYLSWNAAAAGSASPNYPGVTGTVLIDRGASIVADARAQVTLTAENQVTVLGAITAPGGSINLSDSNPVSNQFGTYSFDLSGSIWLGAKSELNVAGTVLINPYAAPVATNSGVGIPLTGEVLPGGSVTLLATNTYLVAQAGALIDVSGASGTFDLPQSGAGAGPLTNRYAATPVWSDAGAVTLGSNFGVFFDGTLAAHGGGASAAGGALTLQSILPVTTDFGATDVTPAPAILVQSSGQLVPQGLRPGEPVESGLTTPSGITHFAVDRLVGSGISTLVLGANPAALGFTNAQGSNSIIQTAPLTIAFAGNVNLSVGQALITDTTTLVALPAGSTSIPSIAQGVSEIGAPTVTLNAPYIELGSAGEVNSNNQLVNMVPTLALAGGTLKVNARTLDLVGQLGLENFANAYFTASGDIRLSSSLAADQAAASNSNNGVEVFPLGELVSAGNLTFQANRLYPATAQPFIIDASAAGLVDADGNPLTTSVTFLGNGASSVPLSAGGALLVDATHIVQEGALRAPSGTITLGVTDPIAAAAAFNDLPLTQTQTVTLAAGSLTSVSLDGALIPYGSTVDGIDYKYQLPGTTALDLKAPPAKAIMLDGQHIALNPGATIDLSGGGDLQAQEWVPGTGGSRNVLVQSALDYATGASPTQVSLFPDDRQVYAILPGYSGTVAPYDPAFVQPGSAVGQSVTLSASPGLPAGTYLLLPAQYATLPGAFRIVPNTGVNDALASQNQVLADGTMIVAGTLSNPIGGTTEARTTSFEVQARSVWEQYSAYTLTSANAFFPVLARNAGVAVPPLPIDAGRLAVGALSTLSLGASIDSATPSGGVGAEIDIASQDIEITGATGTTRAGYLALSADALDSLGAASLLIGGTREYTASGTTLTALADSIVVANDAEDPLTGPEITLLTKTDLSGSDPNAATGLLVTSGSVIRASGAFAASADSAITIGSSTSSGDGALLRVSDGRMVTVNRTDLPATPLGTLTIQDGASISGGQALILNAAGDVNVGSRALFSGESIDADAQRITFVTGGGGSGGLTIGPPVLQQFSNANAVTLRSSGDIDFAGNITVALNTGTLTLSAAALTTSTGSAVTLEAPTLILTNTLGAVPVSVTPPGSGSLTLHAGELDFGSGETASASSPVTTAFYGFGSVNATATHGIAVQGTGGIFDFGNIPVTLAAPIILADTGSTQKLVTTAALTLNSLAGTALSRSALAGSITLEGGSLSDGIEISAPAGAVTLLATTGNLNLGGGASIDTQGFAVPFYDQVEYAPGGAISLTAASGNIIVPASVTLNFAGSATGGDAGSLSVSAPSGIATILGTLAGQAKTGFAGGSFSLATGGAVDLGNLAQELKSGGVNHAISISSGAGNLTLSAGDGITATQIALSADGGAGSAADTANGNIFIAGTLDASGLFGGIIELYGKSSVDVEGSLLARGSDPQQLGGTLILATDGTTDGTYNPTYGYENVPGAGSGKITIGANALLDVTGGSAATVAADGKIGGTILLRAPLLADGGVDVSVANPASLQGSRATTLEAYAVWSTGDKTAGAQHFDGIIDPSGWYDSSGNLVSGIFYAPDGTTAILHYTAGSLSAAQLKPYLTADYFVPTTAYADHQTFYGYQNGDETAAVPGTLMGFVQNPGLTVPADLAAIAHLQVAPGIELDNPAGPGQTLLNNGSIEILTPWNLGALDANGNPVFRLNGIAPILSIRAAGNVLVEASITDGFKQNTDPLPATIPQSPGPPNYVYGNLSDYEGALRAYANEMAAISNFPTEPGVVQYCNFSGCEPLVKFNGVDPISFQSTWSLSPPAMPSALGIGSKTALNSYYEYYLYYAGNRLDSTDVNGFNVGMDAFYNQLGSIGEYGYATGVGYDPVGGTPFTKAASLGQGWNYIAAPLPPSPTNKNNVYQNYYQYISDYSDWVSGNGTGFDTVNYSTTGYGAYFTVVVSSNTNIATLPSPPVPPAVISGPLPPQSGLLGVASYTTYNGPAPVSTPTNPLPLLTANLNAEASSASYRIVAGADFSGANPLAVLPAAIFAPNASGPLAGQGNILIDGHNAFIDSENGTSFAGFEIDQPTTIRTGTGSINLAAGADIQLLDATAPGVIYAAGTPAPLIPASTSTSLFYNYVTPDAVVFPGYIINTGSVQPFGAGNVTLTAGRDITASAALGQLWWPWTNISNVSANVGGDSLTVTLSTVIDFGSFEQGVMSIGGNVTVRAGGSIADLNVSSPTTYVLSAPDPVTGAATIITPDNVQNFINFDANGNRTTPDNVTAVTLGGGNVTVTAAGDILSGSYWAAKGNATLSAGGQIASNLTADINNSSAPIPVSAVLGIADGQLSVSARGNVDIAEVYNPALYDPAFTSPISPETLVVSQQSLYSSSTALHLGSVTGSVTLDSALPVGSDEALPPILDITALQGGITVDQGFALQPSKQSAFNVIASGTVQFAQEQTSQVSAYGSFINPVFFPQSGSSSFDSSQVDPAAPPARIYSLTGDIVDGIIDPVNGYDQGGPIAIDHPSLIYAGHDIINLSFVGQNYYQSDITRIVAAHDLYDTRPLLADANGIAGVPTPYVPLLELGGPGTFDIEAGRNVGPLTNILDAQAAGLTGAANTGIETVGNLLDPTLPRVGANITVLFGIGEGAATASFADQYLDPSKSLPGIPNFGSQLVSFMQQYQSDLNLQAGGTGSAPALTPAAAFAAFQSLPVYRQQILEEQVLFGILNQTGLDYNNPASPYSHQYARGYQAINTLFPASYGYTRNNLSGGTNGAAKPVTTGILDMRSSTIQTQQGGDISILGPGGELLVGSTGAPPDLDPNLTGILTLEQGSINIFADQSVLLAQSRIFTEQGGDVLIWSSNGDINAGEGAKTSFDLPPAAFVCNFDDFCTPNVLGEVSGAGIGVLQTVPNAPTGNADLIAPRGTVDAGAAGIRVSGNLTIAALQVLNAFNVQVGGRSVGVPTPVHIDANVLSAAASVVTATEAATNITHGTSDTLDTIISVEVVGFGEPDEDQRKKLRRH
jgi:filamentous hemagglutinin family protein